MQATRFISLAGIVLASLGLVLGGRSLANPNAGKDTDLITSVAISGDGKTIASASFYNTVKLWDVATGKNIAILDVYGAHAVAFSRNSKILACACSGGFGVNGLRTEGVKLFDVASGKQLALLEHGGVNAVAFHPNGQTLACVNDSIKGHATKPLVNLWKVATAKKNVTLTVWDTNDFMVSALAFDPDGTTLAIGGGSHDAAGKTIPQLQLWDIAAGKKVRDFTGHTGHILCAAIHRDGKLLASAGNDTTIRLWDVASGKNRATLLGHTTPVYCVVFSPDGKLLASADDKTIRLWDVATGKNIWTMQPGFRSVAFTSDGNTLVAGGAPGHVVMLWDVATGKHMKTLK